MDLIILQRFGVEVDLGHRKTACTADVLAGGVRWDDPVSEGRMA